MKDLNGYILEKLVIDKDVSLRKTDAFEIFNEIFHLDNENANTAVKNWIEKYNIKTFNEIYCTDIDFKAMDLSENCKQYIEVMSKKDFEEKAHWFDNNEDSLQNVYQGGFIKIFGWKNGITWGNAKLMQNSFILYYNRKKK